MILMAPDPGRAIAELPEIELRTLLRELETVRRRNDYVAEVWALAQVEAARRWAAKGE